MKSIFPVLTGCCALLFGALLAPAQAQSGNLLENSDFSQGEAQKLPGWIFSAWNFRNDPALGERLDWKAVNTADAGRCLTISSREMLRNVQMWWQSLDFPCAAGAAYEFSVEVKGALLGGSQARPTIGVHFVDANGQWLGIQKVADATLLLDEWQKVKGQVIAPKDAAKMAIRIGIVFDDAKAEIFYKNPILIQTTNSP